MRRFHIGRGRVAVLVVVALIAAGACAHADFLPGKRVLLDAHNCYPYQGRWADRIDRALSTGVPVAIEQDLVWYTDPDTGESRSIVSHGQPYTGDEPGLAEYFFERIRPLVEAALADGDRTDWPLVILNIDFKDDERAHIEAIRSTLVKYRAWLSSAKKTGSAGAVSPLNVGPVLVLSSGRGNQKRVFHDELPENADLLVFGAARTHGPDVEGLSAKERFEGQATYPPQDMVREAATNFRRWWNNSWFAVEAGGARRAGDWNEADAARLRALVEHAHAMGYWIRFYTLDGHEGPNRMGWSAAYNFGSLESVERRWRASIETGVDFVASDQYEGVSALLKAAR